MLKKLSHCLLCALLVAALVFPAASTAVAETGGTSAADETSGNDGQAAAAGTDASLHLLSAAAETGGTAYDSLSAAIAAAEHGATVRLLSDVKEDIVIAEGQDITLDLAGYDLTGIGLTYAVSIEEGAALTLEDSVGSGRITTSALLSAGALVHVRGRFTMTGGSVIGNTTVVSSGAGVYVDGGSFTMSGGSVTDNHALGTSASTSGAGGVLVSGGSFSMSGGSVSGNTTSGNGGGVYIALAGSFTMSAGSITDNDALGAASCGGGVFLNCQTDGGFTMSGGSISGNTAVHHGGGVFVNTGIFVMSGGSVSDNTASARGGGVCTTAKTSFLMEGGSISGNAALVSGGGVYICRTSVFREDGMETVYDLGYEASFTMSGGSISGNTADTAGGGVYLDARAKFTMDGGTITGNGAGSLGGGVYMFSENSSFSLCGTSVIRDNTEGGTAGNVRLTNGCLLSLAGALEAGSYIGVVSSEPDASSDVQITESESGTAYYSSSAAYFRSDDGYIVQGDSSLCAVVLTLGLSHTHTWDSGTVTNPATCAEEGTILYTCTSCGASYFESIPATGHTAVTDPAVEPTCTETGLTEGSHCSVCGEVLTAQETVPAAGHSWDDGVVTKEASIAELGEITYTCTVCGATKTEVIVPAPGGTGDGSGSGDGSGDGSGSGDGTGSRTDSGDGDDTSSGSGTDSDGSGSGDDTTTDSEDDTTTDSEDDTLSDSEDGSAADDSTDDGDGTQDTDSGSSGTEEGSDDGQGDISGTEQSTDDTEAEDGSGSDAQIQYLSVSVTEDVEEVLEIRVSEKTQTARTDDTGAEEASEAGTSEETQAAARADETGAEEDPEMGTSEEIQIADADETEAEPQRILLRAASMTEGASGGGGGGVPLEYMRLIGLLAAACFAAGCALRSIRYKKDIWE